MVQKLKRSQPREAGVRRRAAAGEDSLVEWVYEALVQRIVQGSLTRGMIVSELALAQELGVSRTPVHDAVRQHAKDGLVARKGTRRARVADFSAEDVFEIFEMR